MDRSVLRSCVAGALLLLGRLATLAVPTDPVPCFLPSTVVLEEPAYSIATGDFDNDQRFDLAVTLPVRESVGILLGDGTGGFQRAADIPVGPSTSSVVTADFNRDNKLDLAVSHSSSKISILLGNGTGGFAVGETYTVGLGPLSLAVGDFNQDQNQDLVVGDYGSNSLLVLLGGGTGALGIPTMYPVSGHNVFSVAVGDFNRDFKEDLVTQTDFTGDIVILLGLGDGTFSAPSNFPAGGLPISVSVGHFDSDGNLDVAVANGRDADVSILFGDGAGGFSPPHSFGSGSGARSLTVEDFNFDQNLDVAVVREIENDLLLFAGGESRSLIGPFRYPADEMPRYITAVHLNPDGRPDLAMANAGSVSVALNGLSLFPPAYSALPKGIVGVPFAPTTFSVRGGTPPYSFSTTGVLPPGITLSPSSGVLAGTPTQSGQFVFFVVATSSEGCSATQPYTLLVVSAATSPDIPTLETGAMLVLGLLLSATGFLLARRMD